MKRVSLGAGAIGAAVATLLSAGPSLAHHSFAMFDQTKLVTVTGTVKEFDWTNPHVLLWVVADPNGTPGSGGELWTIELSTSPGPLTRIGWTKHSISPGDHISVDLNPLRSGSPGGSFKKAVLLKTGQVLTTAPPDLPPGSAPPVTPAAAPNPDSAQKP